MNALLKPFVRPLRPLAGVTIAAVLLVACSEKEMAPYPVAPAAPPTVENQGTSVALPSLSTVRLQSEVTDADKTGYRKTELTQDEDIVD